MINLIQEFNNRFDENGTVKTGLFSPLHSSINQLHKYIRAQSPSNTTPEMQDLTKKIKIICEEEQQYYKTRFGFIKQFFSALLRYLTTGIYEDSATRGLALLHSMSAAPIVSPLVKAEKNERESQQIAKLKTDYSKIDSNLFDLKEKQVKGDFYEKGVVATILVSYDPQVVPKAIAQNLMCVKNATTRYCKGLKDRITPMEAALAFFVAGASPITMTGNYEVLLPEQTSKEVFQRYHFSPFNEKGKNFILSKTPYPFLKKPGGYSEVVMPLVEITEQEVEGKLLPSSEEYIPFSVRESTSAEDFQNYEDSLKRHMIHCLRKNNRLPALNEIKGKTVQYDQAIALIESLINEKEEGMDIAAALADCYVEINGHVICVEALPNICTHQIRNECNTFESMLPQGYIYTIDPPAFSVSTMQKNPDLCQYVDLISRLQIATFKILKQKAEINHLKVISFDNFADKKAIELLKNVFPEEEVTIVPRDDLFKDNSYSSFATILHLNNTAFKITNNDGLCSPLFHELEQLICGHSDMGLIFNNDGFESKLVFYGSDGSFSIAADIASIVYKWTHNIKNEDPIEGKNNNKKILTDLIHNQYNVMVNKCFVKIRDEDLFRFFNDPRVNFVKSEYNDEFNKQDIKNNRPELYRMLYPE